MLWLAETNAFSHLIAFCLVIFVCVCFCLFVWRAWLSLCIAVSSPSLSPPLPLSPLVFFIASIEEPSKELTLLYKVETSCFEIKHTLLIAFKWKMPGQKVNFKSTSCGFSGSAPRVPAFQKCTSCTAGPKTSTKKSLEFQKRFLKLEMHLIIPLFQHTHTHTHLEKGKDFSWDACKNVQLFCMCARLWYI